MSDIRIVKQDITTLHVDAIVNAANSSLLGGGGVDGAIHRMAGPELLASCYQSALTLAASKSVESIAFPAISTGAFGYPAQKAARVAVREILNFQQDHDEPKEIILACFDSEMEAIYRALLS